jgi:hypothetical protein
MSTWIGKIMVRKPPRAKRARMKFENDQISARKISRCLFSCATGVEPAGDHQWWVVFLSMKKLGV